MKRRNTLKAIGGIGFASSLGIGAGGTALASDQSEQEESDNPGRVATYNGEKTLVPPDLGGFDRVLLYLADGEPTPDWDSVAEAEVFQREIMGRNTDEILADRNAAVEFYRERFGLNFPEAEAEDDLFTAVDSQSGVDATLSPLMLDPGVGYTAYVLSGRAMPNFHGDGTTNTDTNTTGKVRDGGWTATINEDATLGGSYGADGSSDVVSGTLLAFGDYNIQMGDNEDPIVIHYDSEHPIAPPERVPVAFNCDLEHEEWGEGQVHGTMGGTMAGGIRNVLTFPPTLDSEGGDAEAGTETEETEAETTTETGTVTANPETTTQTESG